MDNMLYNEHGEPIGFAVTCEVGKVEFRDGGELSPSMAAFKLIHDHDAEGTFRFPLVNGQMQVVTITREGDPDPNTYWQPGEHGSRSTRKQPLTKQVR